MEKHIIVERPIVPAIMSVASLSSIWLMPAKTLMNVNYTACSNYRSRVIEAVNKGVL